MTSNPVTPFFSLIIPVYNGGSAFNACLEAIAASQFRDWELIVVDDGSTDQSASVAHTFGATLLKTHGRKGPGAARNQGAAIAKGEYLCFVDADCEVHPDTLTQLALGLRQNPGVDAAFGSYDDAPKATNFVAQFKNLLHHYVHQTGHEEASTFWAGCGVVRRSTFLKIGGFDVQRYTRPCIEDIELGYRIRQNGGSIRLIKQAQVKHFKAWTLWGLIKTDVCDRGIPWTRLLQSTPAGMTNDLNLKTSSRLSVMLVYLLIALLMASLMQVTLMGLAILTAAALLSINWDVYQFFFRKRGAWFTLKSILMHWLYFVYGGAAFVIGLLSYWIEQWASRKVPSQPMSQPVR